MVNEKQPEFTDEELAEMKPPKATEKEIEEDEYLNQPALRIPKKVGTSRFNVSGGIIQTILVSVIVAFIFVFMIQPMAGGGSLVTKTDFETNLANMNATLNQIVSDVAAKQGENNKLVQNIPNQVSAAIGTQNAQISQQLTNLSTKVETFNTNIQNNTNKISEQTTLITALTTRVTELEVKKEEEVKEATTKDPDSIKIKMGYGGMVEFPAGEITTGDATLYFQVENELDVDVENVEIEIVLHSRGIPVTLASTSNVTGGYPLQWQKVYIGNGVFVIKGITPTYGGGLSIDSDDTEDVLVSVKLDTPTAPIDDILFYIEAKVSDYDVVE